MDLDLSLLDKPQRRGLTVLTSNDGGAVWHRVGTGKTRIAYGWFAMVAKEVKVPRGIYIVVCRRQAFGDWWDEAVKMNLDCVVVEAEKYVGFNRRTVPRIFLVSHGMLHKTVEDLAEGWGSMVQAVCYDEGFLYKAPSSQHCQAANELSRIVGRAAIMSGSMMTARNHEDIFGQLYAINRHTLLARTLTEFRSRYMYRLKITGRQTEASRFVNASGSARRISEKLREISSVYFPPSPRRQQNIVRNIDAGKKQKEYIAQLRSEYFLEVDGRQLDLKSAPSLIIKCQQISDGFLTFTKKNEEGKVISKTIVPVPSEKLEYLVAQVCELVSSGERVVVWCAFRESVRIILQRLQKLKLNCYGLIGGETFDIHGWRKNGQVAVATVDCGSSVNHFGQCSYAIYYSMSWKWLSLQQSQGRTDRHDSKHDTCWYYYLYTRGSLDEFVHSTALKSGRSEKELINLTEIRKWLTLHQPLPSVLGKS